MKLKLTWKKKTGQYASGQSLWIGEIRVAEFFWNMSVSRNDPDAANKKWRGSVWLPMFRGNDTLMAGEEADVKIKIETIVKEWFSKALGERID